MIACIVSDGPSAEGYTPNPLHDVVVAVNSRIAHIRADFWCFIDWQTFARYNGSAISMARPITKTVMLTKMSREAPDSYRAFMQWPEPLYLDTMEYAVQHWCSWSGIAALGAVAHLGAEHVDVYGVDLNGETNADGVPSDSRHMHRWALEQQAWDELVHETAIEVERCC
jgi:hypothetical protein